MNYNNYKQLADDILSNPQPLAPYDDPAFMDYLKLNRTRMKRWDLQGELSASLINTLKNINAPQHWIIISEPWCGDAAHIVPFLVKMAEQNSLISYDMQLRDNEPFLINNYLTNGSKSIPILVVRDANNNDIFVWGPRPKGAQEVMNEMKAKNADFENIKTALQNWYNHNKGIELCEEILEHLQ